MHFKKVKRNYFSKRARPSRVTGFTSPATHYTEPRINLNEVLSKANDATYHCLLTDNRFKHLNLYKGDRIIFEKRNNAKRGDLIIYRFEDTFAMEYFDIEIEVQIYAVVTYVIKSGKNI